MDNGLGGLGGIDLRVEYTDRYLKILKKRKEKEKKRKKSDMTQV